MRAYSKEELEKIYDKYMKLYSDAFEGVPKFRLEYNKRLFMNGTRTHSIQMFHTMGCLMMKKILILDLLI